MKAHQGGKRFFPTAKQRKNRIRKLERDQSTIEEKIESLEEKIQELEAQMAQPDVAADFGKLTELQQTYETQQAELESATESWESILLELEELNNTQQDD
ncbi:MAG: ABC transporter C-terminal domain-containing protein [Bacteroidota bacterium]